MLQKGGLSAEGRSQFFSKQLYLKNPLGRTRTVEKGERPNNSEMRNIKINRRDGISNRSL